MKSQSAYEDLKKSAENHPIWSKVLFALFLFSLPGGLIATVKEGIGVYQYFTKEESDFKIRLTILNSRKTDIDLNQICSFSVTENLFSSSTSYGGFGEYLQMFPLKERGTNAFHFKPGTSRDYYVNFPNDQKAQDLMRKGAATVTLAPLVMQGANLSGSISLEKTALRKQKIFIEVK